MAGRPITSTHPRAERWREYRKKQYAESKLRAASFNTKPLAKAISTWRTQ